MTKDDLIAFEKTISELWLAGELPYLFHLSGGNEDQLIELFTRIKPGDYVLSSHRNHYHYLLAGGDRDRLLEEIKGGHSMFIFDRKINFLTSSVLAGTCGIAAGLALALRMKQSPAKVWCFLGDGAAEQGHFYEAVKLVESMDLPCTFVVEDNDRSCDSTKEQRNSKQWIIQAKHVLVYSYVAAYPHCQIKTNRKITFKQVAPPQLVAAVP
jgi:TPP-dependent pyruvate/acetoin dehydrogenase alpha subunit